MYVYKRMVSVAYARPRAVEEAVALLSAGTHEVRLTVTDVCGQTSGRTASIDLVALPVADFAVVSPPCAGAAIAFSNLSAGDLTSETLALIRRLVPEYQPAESGMKAQKTTQAVASG